MLSPIFSSNPGFLLRAIIDETGKPVRMFMADVTSEAVVYNSVEAAEDAFLSRVTPSYSFAPSLNLDLGHSTHDVYMGLVIQINRNANHIAMRTRRGCGNHTFMHPSVAAIMSNCQVTKPLTAGRKVGRWTELGSINGSITVWGSEHLPEDMVYTVYCDHAEGTTDGPAALWMDGDKVLLADGAKHSNPLDYVGAIRILPPETTKMAFFGRDPETGRPTL